MMTVLKPEVWRAVVLDFMTSLKRKMLRMSCARTWLRRAWSRRAPKRNGAFIMAGPKLCFSGRES
jgi:hypothetical protein